MSSDAPLKAKVSAARADDKLGVGLGGLSAKLGLGLDTSKHLGNLCAALQAEIKHSENLRTAFLADVIKFSDWAKSFQNPASSWTAIETATSPARLPNLNEFFAVQRKPSQNGFPRVDVYEHDSKFVVEFSMAGVAPEDVKIEIEDQHPHNREYAEYGKLLKVSGKMATAYEHRKDATYHVKELTRKHFLRSMLLPQYVKDDPKAVYNNGMLTLTFDTDHTPVEEKPRSKVIQITNNAGHCFTDRDGEVGGK